MNNNFKQYDFVYHIKDNVNGVIVSDIYDIETAAVFWEDGIYSKTFRVASEVLSPGTKFNIQDAYAKYIKLVEGKTHPQNFDNLTYVELLDKVK